MQTITILSQCKNCKYFMVYGGSKEPDDPPFVSCKKGVFEYTDPDLEWDNEDCDLKETTK